MVVAPARCAMNRCSAGSMIKSFPEMAYHDGRVCDATASGKFLRLGSEAAPTAGSRHAPPRTGLGRNVQVDDFACEESAGLAIAVLLVEDQVLRNRVGVRVRTAGRVVERSGGGSRRVVRCRVGMHVADLGRYSPGIDPCSRR